MLPGAQQRRALHDLNVAGEDGDAVVVAHFEPVALDLDRLVAVSCRPVMRLACWLREDAATTRKPEHGRAAENAA